MKKIFFMFDLVVAVCFCFALDPAEGYWLGVDSKTGAINAVWQMYQSGDKLLGKLLFSPVVPPEQIALKCKDTYKGFPVVGAVNKMKVIGTPWIFGLIMDKPGQWIRGNVIDPEHGSMYQCKITFRPADGKRFAHDTLEMRGELLPGIGASIFMQRISSEEALALQNSNAH
ncbi:MAG: DUF2147 domain-containing protein [Spirochaetaceae bacterium]|jgi:uncharacterized protein (DUF2147 family)|nr:DUF2147 domain-containing protein [Spirochaetaceae bacterium]